MYLIFSNDAFSDVMGLISGVKPWLSLFAANLSPARSGSDLKPERLEFVVNKLELGHTSFERFGFLLSGTVYQLSIFINVLPMP